jgi:Tfp pilus assembly protein PilO
MFIAILAITAFVIAGVAAYFSVQGIATLYAGAFLSVLVMAGALEVGKLVATSFLYRYWYRTNILLKTYLLVAIIALMGITSMGIFGFLTSAYQTSLAQYSTANTQQEFLLSQKEILQSELDSLNARIQTLNESRKSQESRLPSMSRLAAKPVYEDIARAGEEIKQARDRMQILYSEIKVIDDQSFEAQKQASKQKDISTLKYAAELFNTDINTIVKWFTIAIIFVFDPLAICLVLAYNVAIGKRYSKESTEDTNEEITSISRIKNLLTGKAKYRN